MLGDIKIYTHFVSFLNAEITQEGEILSDGRKGAVYAT